MLIKLSSTFNLLTSLVSGQLSPAWLATRVYSRPLFSSVHTPTGTLCYAQCLLGERRPWSTVSSLRSLSKYLYLTFPGVRSDRRWQRAGGGLVLRGRRGTGRRGPPLGADGARNAQSCRHVAHAQID